MYGWEKTVDDDLTMYGGPSLAQKINLGIVRDVEIKFGNQFRFWNAKPIQWYGEDYAGMPRVGHLNAGSW